MDMSINEAGDQNSVLPVDYRQPLRAVTSIFDGRNDSVLNKYCRCWEDLLAIKDADVDDGEFGHHLPRNDDEIGIAPGILVQKR